MWEEINQQILRLYSCTVEVWQWIRYFSAHFIMGMPSCTLLNNIFVIKRANHLSAFETMHSWSQLGNISLWDIHIIPMLEETSNSVVLTPDGSQYKIPSCDGGIPIIKTTGWSLNQIFLYLERYFYIQIQPRLLASVLIPCCWISQWHSTVYILMYNK